MPYRNIAFIFLCSISNISNTNLIVRKAVKDLDTPKWNLLFRIILHITSKYLREQYSSKMLSKCETCLLHKNM